MSIQQVGIKPVDISFLIPTNRENLIYAAVDALNRLSTKYSYEICVYSTFPVNASNVVWEEEKDKLGPLWGFNYLANKSTGRYVVCLTDDHYLTAIDPAIDRLESDEFKDKRFKILSLAAHDGVPSYTPGSTNRLGSVMSLPQGIEKYTTMRFPVISRDTLNNHLNGFIFHPEFRYHAADVYLGYYLGKMGEPGKEDINCRVIPQGYAPKCYTWEIIDCNTCWALMENLNQGRTKYVEPEHPLYQRCKFKKNEEIYSWT